jgi:uncharacterized membrane protein YqjE
VFSWAAAILPRLAMVPEPVIPEQPSMTNALERVLSASQELVVNRLDLLPLEAKEGMSRGIEAAVVAGVAAGVFFSGWLCINALLAVFFQATASLSGVPAVLAAVNLGVGVFAIAAARQLAAPKPHAGESPSPLQKGGA